MRKSETKMIDDAVGKVKNELLYYLNEEYDWFWDIETDVAKDYQYYFHESNSQKLAEIFEKKLNKNKKGKTPKNIQTYQSKYLNF